MIELTPLQVLGYALGFTVIGVGIGMAISNVLHKQERRRRWGR